MNDGVGSSARERENAFGVSSRLNDRRREQAASRSIDVSQQIRAFFRAAQHSALGDRDGVRKVSDAAKHAAGGFEAPEVSDQRS